MQNICNKCEKETKEIIRGLCRKCYNALLYNGELLKLEKPIIDSFTKIQNELLVGSLLGDACLHRNKNSKFAYLKIEFHLKF